MADDHWEDVTTAVSVDALTERSAAKDQPYLTVMAGSRVGEMIRIAEEVTIGRGADADFRITDVGVSRLHLSVRKLSDGRVLMEDLRSRNGTFVNGARIEKAMLNDGDKIQVGSTAILKFSYGDRLDQTFQQALYDAALRDPLTKLYNRRYLFEQLEIEFTYAQRHGTPMCVIMMDLDHFKAINDTHGHATGDLVLQGLAQTLSKAIRREDVAARYGGEEFILVCRGIDGSVGKHVANRIRKAIESTQLVPSLPELRVTLSAGVVDVPRPGIDTTEALVKAADSALYQAKEAGRNQVMLFVGSATKPST